MTELEQDINNLTDSMGPLGQDLFRLQYAATQTDDPVAKQYFEDLAAPLQTTYETQNTEFETKIVEYETLHPDKPWWQWWKNNN